MIEAASLTGADAIEFQLAYADDFYIRSEEGHRAYKSREFNDEQLKFLVDFSHKVDLEFVATCLSYKLVEKMNNFGADIFNINASDINNPSIIDAVVNTKKPFFVSMPLATINEIKWVYERIVNKNPNAVFVFLQGQHPMASGEEFVHIEDTSLGIINSISKHYNKPVGFIDHTSHIWMPSIAVAAGACVVTKHMTLSHLYNGPDKSICLDPEQMKIAVETAKKVFNSLQVVDKELAKGEDMDRTIMRRSIVSIRNIKKGEVISIDDIEFKRPGIGISPDKYESIIGKVANVDIDADTVLDFKMFENVN
jgi:sialic acid synthase SpsE